MPEIELVQQDWEALRPLARSQGPQALELLRKQQAEAIELARAARSDEERLALARSRPDLFVGALRQTLRRTGTTALGPASEVVSSEWVDLDNPAASTLSPE